MVYFTAIKKTIHYEENHEQDIPWSEVIEIIFKSTKIKDFWRPENLRFS